MKKSKFIYFFIKRIVDLVFSIIGIILLFPISLVVKISFIITKDFAPIFFVQRRVGKDGKIFKLYKFRTMIINADDVLLELLNKDKDIRREYTLNKKIKNDPRLTKVGKIIRKFSIDEMPQFINILKGEMSLIGNRPYLEREIKDMKGYYNDIVKTKPGLTGLWQTSGRNDVSFKKRLKLEKEYSSICSLKLDVIIFFKTFKVLFLDNSTN